MDSAPNSQEVGFVAAICLLLVRGMLLWVAAPLGVLAWLILTPWLRPRRVTLGQFLGWVDNNLVAGLERSVLRPLFPRAPQPWIPARHIEQVRNRVRINDLY